MRPTSGSQDGIWVTNAMLVRAIERFHHVYPVPRRSLSSCPGPMESRRRLGKRHMTAIIPDSRPSPFPWTIELPINLGEWNWEAPAPPRNRHKKKTGVLESFLRWLEDLEHKDGSTTEQTTPTSQTANPSPVGQALVDLNRKLASFHELGDSQALYNVCESYLEQVSDMAKGAISSDDLLLALDPFGRDFKQRATPEVLDNVIARQWVCILQSIEEGRTHRTDDPHGEHMWYRCFETAIHMTAQYPTFHFLDALLRTTRSYERCHLGPKEYLELMQKHIMLEASRTRSNPSNPISTHILRRHVFLSRMFQLKTATHMDVYEQLSKSCLEMAKDGTHRRLIAFHLLLKLAGAAGPQYHVFPSLIRQIHDVQDWTEAEVLQITATRIMNKSTGGFSITQLYKWLGQPSHLHSWAEMTQACLSGTTRKRNNRLKALLYCSDALGHLDSVVKSAHSLPSPAMVAAENPQMLEHETYETVLAKMVRAVQNYHLALMVWDMYNEGLSEPEKLSWHVWMPYMEDIMLDPDLPSNLIWSIASFLPDKASHRLPWYVKGSVRHAIDALENIGNWYMKRPNLTHRMRLRRIENVISRAQAARRGMPQSLMQNLAELLVSDLEMGRMGRKARLRYLVDKTKQFYGEEQARRVAVQLDGWRWTIQNRVGKVMQMPRDERGETPQCVSRPGLEKPRESREEGSLQHTEFEDRETQQEEDDNSFDELMKAQRKTSGPPQGSATTF
ncbi:hypothetical protein FSARC_7771 [Fusarium sarcochroum]|uniref:Uncharacterized protein n=1 Tax=Fusarium sarcochroum TaxID=1208366 RepID=A0A8H4X7X6_9HYPO|nr:hypothetical protein FSARC_7771 [Fusarium sarcochroum]